MISRVMRIASRNSCQSCSVAMVEQNASGADADLSISLRTWPRLDERIEPTCAWKPCSFTALLPL